MIAYLAGAWLLIQIAETVVQAYGLADSVTGILITVLTIGLVPVAILSWAFEWTSDGLKRDADAEPGGSDGKSLDRVVMVVLALAVGFFAFDKFVLDPGRDAELTEQVRADALVESFPAAPRSFTVVRSISRTWLRRSTFPMCSKDR